MDLLTRDFQSCWHPFASANDHYLPVVAAEGEWLIAEGGQRYLDATSSWWCNLHGHCHPHIVQAIATQAATLDHVLFGSATHPQAVRLAERLLALTGFDKVFFSDNGSTAVESALKMAIQSSKRRGPILTLKNSYHGDTFGSMSVAKSAFHTPFAPYCFPTIALDPAHLDLTPYLDQEPLLFIYEPAIQGAAGMRPYSTIALDEIIGQCRRWGILTIADEVMTGFGRTGPLFVSSALRHQPDFLCLSKGITGGTLPMAATLTSNAIFRSIDRFLHGHTYTANPIACAAANASLDLLAGSNRTHIEQAFQRLKTLKAPRVTVLGTIAAIELPSSAGVVDHFLQRGILVRPLGNVLYFMPPYCISDEALNLLIEAVYELPALQNRRQPSAAYSLA